MAATMRTPMKLILQAFARRNTITLPNFRRLLTDEYKCHHAWNQRLNSPILQTINFNEFVNKLIENTNKNRSLSAIDMDIVASKLELVEPSQLDYVLNLFYRFRHSKDAVNGRQSMSHAVVRSLLHMGEIEHLMNILRDKINYGIFLDHFTANLLLDYCITNQRYQDAAEVAVDLMLQEDLTHPLCRALSLLACHRRLPQLLVAETDFSDASNTNEQEPLYKRVRFIENPWYDDHFDIPTERQRIGKTITVLTSSNDNPLNRGYQLIGLALYEKLDKVVGLMQQWMADPAVSPCINSVELELVQKILESIKTKELIEPKEPGLRTLEDLYPHVSEKLKSDCLEQFMSLCDKLKDSGKVASTEATSTDLELSKRAMDALVGVSSTDTAAQIESYTRWMDEQQRDLSAQVHSNMAQQKKREIAERLLSLRKLEEKLRFFEQQTKIDLTIADAPVEVPIKVVSIEEQFVAPPGERRPSGADAMKKGR